MSIRRFLPVFLVGLAFGVAVTQVSAQLDLRAIFRDVPSDSPHMDGIRFVYENGLMRGRGDVFGVGQPITRDEFATVMMRYDKLLRGSGVSPAVSSRSSRSSSVKSSSSSSEEEQEDEEESSSSSSSSSSKVTSVKGVSGGMGFTKESFDISESSPDASIAVVRASGDGTASIEYETIAGTAVEDTDYNKTSGKLSFADGETMKIINVNVKNDKDPEAKESFTVKLKNPTGETGIGKINVVNVNILDNDGGLPSSGSTSGTASSSSSLAAAGSQGRLGFSAVVYSVSEQSGKAVITVERTEGTAGAVGVSYATSNGTADGNHYSAVSGTLSFAEGETIKTFEVIVADNSTTGGNKAFNLTLSAPTGGAVLGTAKSSVTIVDNETAKYGSGSLKISRDSYDAYEGETVAVTIQRVGGASGTATVSYGTTDGTAKSGTDYTGVSGTLTFRNGEANKEVLVKITQDSSNEASIETLTFNLTSPVGVSLTTPSSAIINIED